MNLSQASQACLFRVFGAGVKFYFEHTIFFLQFSFLCLQDFDTTITGKFQIIIINKFFCIFVITITKGEIPLINLYMVNIPVYRRFLCDADSLPYSKSGSPEAGGQGGGRQ